MEMQAVEVGYSLLEFVGQLKPSETLSDADISYADENCFVENS